MPFSSFVLDDHGVWTAQFLRWTTSIDSVPFDEQRNVFLKTLPAHAAAVIPAIKLVEVELVVMAAFRTYQPPLVWTAGRTSPKDSTMSVALTLVGKVFA